MNGRYKVTAPRAVLDHEPGDVFEHEFTADEEKDLLAAGRLALEPREFVVVGASKVFDAEPGEHFTAALTVGQTEALVDGGHVELVVPKAAAPSKSSKSKAAVTEGDPGDETSAT